MPTNNSKIARVYGAKRSRGRRGARARARQARIAQRNSQPSGGTITNSP